MARQYIGPKLQAASPVEVNNWVNTQIKRRRVAKADVVRELIMAGYTALALAEGGQRDA